MAPRSVLKSLKDFSKRELREKNADRVRVQRIKMKSLMRRGRLPDLRIKKIEGCHYLVCVFRNKSLRVYYMDKAGRMMGADEFTGEDKDSTWREISKETKTILQF